MEFYRAPRNMKTKRPPRGKYFLKEGKAVKRGLDHEIVAPVITSQRSSHPITKNDYKVLPPFKTRSLNKSIPQKTFKQGKAPTQPRFFICKKHAEYQQRLKNRRVKQERTKADRRRTRKFDSTKGYPGEGPAYNIECKDGQHGNTLVTRVLCPCDYGEECVIAGHYHRITSPKSGFARRKAEEKGGQKKPKTPRARVCKTPLACPDKKDHHHDKEQSKMTSPATLENVLKIQETIDAKASKSSGDSKASLPCYLPDPTGVMSGMDRDALRSYYESLTVEEGLDYESEEEDEEEELPPSPVRLAQRQEPAPTPPPSVEDCPQEETLEDEKTVEVQHDSPFDEPVLEVPQHKPNEEEKEPGHMADQKDGKEVKTSVAQSVSKACKALVKRVFPKAKPAKAGATSKDLKSKDLPGDKAAAVGEKVTLPEENTERTIKYIGRDGEYEDCIKTQTLYLSTGSTHEGHGLKAYLTDKALTLIRCLPGVRTDIKNKKQKAGDHVTSHELVINRNGENRIRFWTQKVGKGIVFANTEKEAYAMKSYDSLSEGEVNMGLYKELLTHCGNRSAIAADCVPLESMRAAALRHLFKKSPERMVDAQICLQTIIYYLNEVLKFQFLSKLAVPAGPMKLDFRHVTVSVGGPP